MLSSRLSSCSLEDTFLSIPFLPFPFPFIHIYSVPFQDLPPGYIVSLPFSTMLSVYHNMGIDFDDVRQCSIAASGVVRQAQVCSRTSSAAIC